MHQRRLENLTTRVSLALHDEAAPIAVSELFLYLKCRGNQLITNQLGGKPPITASGKRRRIGDVV